MGPLAAVPTVFLMSGKDASVPAHVDLPALARKFEVRPVPAPAAAAPGVL